MKVSQKKISYYTDKSWSKRSSLVNNSNIYTDENYNYENKNVCSLIVNNSTIINKTDNRLSPATIEHSKAMIFDVDNPGSGWGWTQNVAELKRIPTLPRL